MHGQMLRAFVPDKQGNWKIIVDDGLGHRKEVNILILDDFFQTGEPATSQDEAGNNRNVLAEQIPLYLKVIVGLSLIICLTGVFYWIKARNIVKGKGSKN